MGRRKKRNANNEKTQGILGIPISLYTLTHTPISYNNIVYIRFCRLAKLYFGVNGSLRYIKVTSYLF